MPAESARFYRRLGRRDRWFIASIVVATVVITIAAIAFRGDSGRPGADRGCFSITRPGFMGAQTGTYCGAAARTFCRTASRDDHEIATKCAALGLKRPKAS